VVNKENQGQPAIYLRFSIHSTLLRTCFRFMIEIDYFSVFSVPSVANSIDYFFVVLTDLRVTNPAFSQRNMNKLLFVRLCVILLKA